MEIVDVAVIGAGLCGAAIAHELVENGYQTVVFESAPEIAAGASRANSGVLHTGFDSEAGTLETALIREQARRWPEVFKNLAIPYRRCGALLLARELEDVEHFPRIAAEAARNGVRIRAIDRKELRRREPFAEGIAAIAIDDEAITDPFEVVTRLLASVRLHVNARVLSVEEAPGGAVLRFESNVILAQTVVNCAGLYADEIAGDGSFRIVPRHGDFAVYAPAESAPLAHVLLPMPAKQTKGVLVFPTLYGHVCAGPSAFDQDDKDDWRPREEPLRAVVAAAETMFPPLRSMQRVDTWAGLRPSGAAGNYVIGWSGRVPAMLNVGAIRSTGLSACLGIATYVRDLFTQRDIRKRAPVFAVPPARFEPSRPWWERVNALHGLSGPC